MGTARFSEGDPAQLARLVDLSYEAAPERGPVFTVEAWDLNDWLERYGDHSRSTPKDGDWVSPEFAVTVPVAEWDDQPVTIMREEETLVASDGSPEYLSGPQIEPGIIR